MDFLRMGRTHVGLQRPLAALVATLILLTTHATALTAPATVPDLYEGVLPDLREEIRADTDGELSSYTIEVTLDQATSTIAGTEHVTFVNQTEDRLEEVNFRLYPNAFYYGEGGLTVDRVQVDGETVAATTDVVETVLRVPLETPLRPGASVELELEFSVVVPADSDGSFGIFNRDTLDGTWVLADWYPIVAGYEPEVGWRLDEPTALGDPTFSEAALYDVTVISPGELTVVATGSILTSDPVDGGVARRFISGPVREFTMVVDDDYVAIREKAGETTITAYANPGNEEASRRTMETAAAALIAYSEQFGPYPYEELDLVEASLAGALGVSWSGLIFVDAERLYENPTYRDDPARFDFVLAHEVGHQWWGGSVGANSNDHTFMIEGLTNYLVVVFFESTAGTDVAQQQLVGQIVQPYLSALERYGDGIVDLPITAERTGPPRGVLDYGKAAIGFLAIRREIGDDAFFAALRDYADDFSFAIATPDDLLTAFEDASDEDLDALWTFWFESAETTAEDVAAVMNEG